MAFAVLASWGGAKDVAAGKWVGMELEDDPLSTRADAHTGAYFYIIHQYFESLLNFLVAELKN